MLFYLIRRVAASVFLLFIASFVSFTVITLPPGDYLTSLQAELTQRAGMSLGESKVVAEQFRRAYGLDQPFLVQYTTWVSGIILHGDFGYSFKFGRPVSKIIWGRIAWTLIITISSLFFSFGAGVLSGIYSAVHQYSIADNALTVCAFLGLSIPSFFFALLMVYVMVFVFRSSSIGGLFSPELVLQPWSWIKFVDLLKHIWVPVLIIGTAGTARNMRVMRGNLLDILGQQYIQVARAKGLREHVVIYKHAVRNAIHPIIMSFGMVFPDLIQGTMVIAVILNLPTTGPLFLHALEEQDMYLAGTLLLLMAILTIVGNFLSDLVLAWIDPRIRYD